MSHALTVPINAKEIWYMTVPINAKNGISGQGILPLQVYEKVSYAVRKCTLLFVKAINPTDFQRTFSPLLRGRDTRTSWIKIAIFHDQEEKKEK